MSTTLGTVTIRRAVPADAAALAQLAARTFADTFGAYNDPQDMRTHLSAAFGVRQQAAELADPHAVTLLAERDDVAVGFAQVRRNPPPSGIIAEQSIELQRFYVDRNAHGTGLAQRLMQAAREAARGLGGARLWLGVWERNARAIAFYAKEGFVDVGSKHFDVGSDRQTDRVLVAELGAPARELGG